MLEKIRMHVEELFAGAPKTRRAAELKQELIANLQDRYEDLIAEGKDDETAYGMAIANIGDVDELIRGLREQDIFDPVSAQVQRQKSALYVSIAVGLFVISFIFPMIFSSGLFPLIGMEILGSVLMFVCWTVASMLLVFNALSKPKYIKAEETIVEDFKKWSADKQKYKAVRGAIYSIVWLSALMLFFIVSFFFRAPHIAWVVFILALVVNQIVKLIFLYKENS